MLPYPPNAIGLEVAFVFFWGIIEWVRLKYGASWVGNDRREPLPPGAL
jgi:hypothetical protein